VTLIVQDDGCGLGQAAQNLSSRHFGLQGIRERVDKLGGALSIDSTPGHGTCVSVTVPAHRPPRAGALAQVAS
jgi:signal transduction histidine kinase